MTTNDEHPAATTSRMMPEDLRMHRYHHGYVVTLCGGRSSAERAAQALVDAGFQREELVLVSRDVDALDAGWPGEDSLEVTNPESLGRPTAGVAAGITSGFAGALFGAAAANLLRRGSDETWLWVVAGLVIGALLGATLGMLGYRALRRRPLAYYDERLSGEQVLVGVGLLRADDTETRTRARRTLEGIGVEVIDLPE